MTLAEFFNELRRLHCIDGWCVPELGEDVDMFLAHPVMFFIRCTDAQREIIWQAMRRDAVDGPQPPPGMVVVSMNPADPEGSVINLMDALRKTIDD